MSKFCIDCQYCEKRDIFCGDIYHPSYIYKYNCKSPRVELDLVTKYYRECEDVRTTECGKEGKFYIQKQPEKPFSFKEMIFGKK